MTLGEKLRLARIEAGLSQRQAAGEDITRNMLSQLEHDTARPSMRTLAILAQRLGKPVSFFLEDTAVTSPNQAQMDAARTAFRAGAHDAALAALEDYRAPDAQFDGERALLTGLCLMEQGSAALADGRPILAREKLVLAGIRGGESPYWSAALERERILRLGQTGQEEPESLVSRLPEDDRESVLRARAALDGNDPARCGQILDGAPGRESGHWHFLRGEAYFALGQYDRAKQHYLAAEKEQPRQVLPRLEACFRELGDYERAYYYACRQREG